MLEERHSSLQDKSSPFILKGMNISERLKLARKHAGLTQSELAERAQITQATVSELERGIARSSVHIVKLAMICGVRPQWLAEGTGDMEPPPGPGSAGFRVAQDEIARVKDQMDSFDMGLIEKASPEELELAKVVMENISLTMANMRRKLTESMKESGDLDATFSRISSPRAAALVVKLAKLAAEDELSESDISFLESVLDRVGDNKK